MKKAINLMALFALIAGFSFTSCSTEDPAEAVPVEPPRVSWEKTATIIGYVRTLPDDLDITGTTHQKYSIPAVSNLKLHVSIPYAELMSDYPQTDNVVKNWTTMVEVANVEYYDPATGKFSVKVPVGLDTTHVTIVAEDYIGRQTQIIGYGADEIAVRKTLNGIWVPGEIEYIVRQVGNQEVIDPLWKRVFPTPIEYKEIPVVTNEQVVVISKPITFGFIEFETERYNKYYIGN